MPKPLPKYTEIKLAGGSYILYTEPPFYIGRVWMYTNIHDLQSQVQKLNPLSFYYIPDYAIAVTIWTALGQITPRPGIKEQADIITYQMGEFFEQTRIAKNPRFYNKFR